MNKALLCFVVAVLIVCINAKLKVKHIIQVGNIKDYKKVLKTHKNVLTIYSKDDKPALPLIRWMEDVAKDIKGKGTFVYINCGESKDAKKLCKKYNISPKPTLLKHYKGGAFHKDYDRKDTAKSMLNFMLDPTGDAPWEEDPAAENVVQVNTEKELIKLRRKEKGPLLIMFYAPWCGYCKKLKPEYAAAANELKGKAVLAGMNVDKPETQNVRYEFNITGYPTMIYFEKGAKKFNYGGGMDKAGIVEWMTDPKEKVKEVKDDEKPWSEEAPEILHITDATLASSLKDNPSILIMFYAPWCGHCKTMKPEYVEAAKQMKEEQISGTLAAVDCTISKDACSKYDVSGYPTVKYFADGEVKFKVSLREKSKIVEFMKKPEEPPAPPPEDMPWPDVSGPEILHLNDANFKDELKKKKHVLVMFYAPWCGHCKKAKPEMQTAAEHYKDDRKVWFAGIDCTIHKKICSQFGVEGYPTFRYFLYGKKDFSYPGGRAAQGFIDFMKDPQEKPEAEAEEAEPEWKDTPSGVVHMADSDFDDFIKTHSSVLVMFYAPWCGHCKSMKPDYTEAANEMLNQDHVIAAMDCTKNRKTCSTYNIEGYPTLKHFNKGTPAEYAGGRSKAEIMNYLSSEAAAEAIPEEPLPVTGWAAENEDVVHLTDETFDAFIEGNPSVLTMFYAPWCGHCKRMKPAYGEAAKFINTENQVDGKISAIDCTVNDKICERFGVRGFPTLKYFKDGKEEFKYGAGRSKEDIIEFMKDPKAPPPKPVVVPWSDENKDVAHLTDATFRDFVKSETHVLVMFYAPWCGHCKKMKPAYSEAAKIINTENQVQGKLAAIDCDENKEMAKKYGVKGYPTLKYFRKGADFMKYEGSRNTESILDFMKTADTKTRKTWAEEVSDVHHLTNLTFHDFLKDKDALVMFYAPWCGHCNSMKPAYMEAAALLKQDHFPGVLAAMDSTLARNLSKEEGVQGYPSLRYYRNGKFMESFDDHRTVQNIMDFMKKQFEPDGSTASALDGSKWSDLPSSVLHLTGDNIDTVLPEIPHSLVAYHVKWCTNCLKMRSAFMKAASRLPQVMTIAAIDCDDHADKCKEHGVTSYPAMKYYASGKFNENYSGKLDVDSIVNYMLSNMKDSKEEL